MVTESNASSRQAITVHVHKRSAYVWSADDALRLRSQHRIMGNMLATVSGQKQQNGVRGPPLYLEPEEVTLLLEEGVIHIVQVSINDKQRERRAPVESSEDESIPDEWSGLHCTPFWQTAIQTQQMLTVLDFSSETWSSTATWDFPNTLVEQQRYAVFKDMHKKGYFLTRGLKFGADFLAYSDDPELCHSTFAVKVVPGGVLEEFDLGASCRAATGARKRLLIVDPTCANGKWTLEYKTVAFQRLVRKKEVQKEAEWEARVHAKIPKLDVDSRKPV